ncbi:MAG: Methyltransferase type 11 [Myxococcales bacterium]|nr:Methyltransferase type 11 [Myxococcales bacterium]
MGSNLEHRIRALAPWFHNLTLDGIETAPDHFLGDYPRQKFRRFAPALPQDLSGKSVLDIGCNAGFYAFEMKQRGASRVVAIDTDERYLAQARLAAEVLGHDIELRALDVYRVGELGERFDLVIFMGVLYHLRHPLLALDRLYDHVVDDRLLFQSMLRGPRVVAPVAPDYVFGERAIFDRPGHPAVYFVEHKYAGDWTNWWIPNRAGVEAMLRSSGFVIEVHAEDEVYVCRRGPARSHESEALP